MVNKTSITKIWNLMERGLMKSFGRDGRSAILLSSKNQDMMGGVVLEKVLYKYIVFFRAIHRRNNGYFAKFVICEFANFVVLCATWYCTDIFLRGKFLSYGWNVITNVPPPINHDADEIRCNQPTGQPNPNDHEVGHALYVNEQLGRNIQPRPEHSRG